MGSFQPKGFNPVHGYDNGQLPPGSPSQAAQPALPAPVAWPGTSIQSTLTMYQQPATAPAPAQPQAPAAQMVVIQWPYGAASQTMPVGQQWGIAAPAPAQPQAAPAAAQGTMVPYNPTPAARSIPGTSLINSTGGIGLEEGFSYIYPREHTKIKILCSPIAPWELADNESITPQNITPCYVSVAVTMRELFLSLGMVPERSRITEVTEMGDGKWSMGQFVDGSKEEHLNKTCRDLGWDETRTGNIGVERHRDVVWIWLQGPTL